jgi:hypothetical protein
MIYQNQTEKDLYDRRPAEAANAEFQAKLDANKAVRARGSDLQPQTPAGVRTFGTGATRDLDANKLDFEGFLSPLVLERYAQHMHKARKMADGSMRASDNWQLGIPQDAYMKSLFRHFFDVWKRFRGWGDDKSDIETELCALLFNANGMLHEILKEKRTNAGL